MDGGDDFRPGGSPRASDPSVTDMLRRARDARLGTTLGAVTNQPVSASRRLSSLRGRLALLVLGALLGVLMTYLVGAAGTAGSTSAPGHVVGQINTSTPTVAPPTPTTAPYPLTTDEIGRLAQEYYDVQGPGAGDFVMLDDPHVWIERLDNNRVTACVTYRYAYAASGSPNAAEGTNTRTFTLAPRSDGTWQVLQMGGSDSCRPG